MFIKVDGGRADGLEVRLPGVSGDEYRLAQQRAQAGDIHAPEIWRLVEAMSTLIGHDLDAVSWGVADMWGFAKWVGLVDETVWTGLEDAELTLLLQEGASDV